MADPPGRLRTGAAAPDSPDAIPPLIGEELARLADLRDRGVLTDDELDDREVAPARSLSSADSGGDKSHARSP